MTAAGFKILSLMVFPLLCFDRAARGCMVFGFRSSRLRCGCSDPCRLSVLLAERGAVASGEPCDRHAGRLGANVAAHTAFIVEDWNSTLSHRAGFALLHDSPLTPPDSV